MSRTTRFLHGIRLGYLNQALTTIVGIWLTPFLLSHLSEARFGVWLTITQMLGYLLLLDLGVIALVPRETAYAVGRGGGVDETRELAPLLGRTLRLVAWQLPVLCVASAGLWFFLPARWEEARSVLLPILVIFLACWPFRILLGALEGLQQFRFTGRLQMVLWTAQTATTIGLVALGVGLPSLAWGWGVQQVGAALAALVYFARRFPQHLPRTFPPLTRAVLADQLSRGIGATISQAATVLVYGSDLLIIARLLGPEAAVPYALTAKLVTILQQQPMIIMHSATPAIAELSAAKEGERVARAIAALSLGVLLVSGALATLVVVVNEGFVRWWVGSQRYGGLALTVAIVGVMMLRQWAVSMNYTNFALGGERSMAPVNLADGVVTVVASVVLIRLIGPIGAPLGSLAGVVLVSIPFSVRILLRELHGGARLLAGELQGFAVRFVIALTVAALVASRWTPHGPIQLAGAAAATGVVYLLLMLPTVRTSALGTYLVGHLPGPASRALRVLARIQPVSP